MNASWEIGYDGLKKTPQELLDYILPRIKPEDMEVLRIAFKHKGILFGGAIRDLYTGDKSRDLDFIFPTKEKVSDFHFDLRATFLEKGINYVFWEGFKYGGADFMEGMFDHPLPDNHTLYIDSFSREAYEKHIAPIADFDCNLLTFNGEKLGFLAEGKTVGSTKLTLEGAVLHLINFQAFVLSPHVYKPYIPRTYEGADEEEPRVKKMEKKNFEIICEISE